MANVDMYSLVDSAVSGSAENMRTLFETLIDNVSMLGNATGNNFLAPTSGKQAAAIQPPSPGSISVSGANGSFSYQITPAAQSISATIYQQVAYSPVKNFGGQVTTLPVSTATSGNIPAPGQTVFVRFRSSYDQQNWNAWTVGTAAVSSGLQSSAAQDNNTVLNQSNYLYVDSQSAGGAANVRVYGAAGPYNSGIAVKGAVESIAPSATIVNVAQDSSQFVSYTGEMYRVTPQLPGTFPDTDTPIGKVAVVGGGSPTLPVINLLVQGGYVVGIKSTSTFGTGLTQLPTFVVSDATGHGATIIATGLSGGAITGIQVTNNGDGNYSSTPTVTASGGTFTGSTGGGTATGGNGGRMTDV